MAQATRGCYHPNITGLEAEKLLLDKGHEGSYLTRPSQNTPGNYSLSVRRGDKVTHVRIQNHGDYYDLYGGEKFANLAELIEFYIENPDQLKEVDGSIIRLEQPFFSEEVEEMTAKKWYHGGITGKKAEELLMAKGRHGSYMIRISNSTPGNYVLTARVQDEVTHLTISYSNKHYFIGSKKFISLNDVVTYCKTDHVVDTNGRVVELIKPFGTSLFLPLGVKQRVADLEKESIYTIGKCGFFDEFEQLQRQENSSRLRSRHEGNKEKNRNKNRFRNILPFDHSMVILKGPFNLGSGYINANYIDGEVPGSKRCYIATQGCLPGTINDFWTMIWQENSLIIVMITKEVERGRNKCSRYWPKEEGAVLYGAITVSLLEETVNAHSVLRCFNLMYNHEQRIVFQYQFKSWPEHGVPQDAGIFLAFMDEINLKTMELKDAKYNPGPIVVHCSAGIGRTGTYIAIDVLVKVIEYQGWEAEIDVQKSIQLLRQFRSGMVQNDQQYRLIYYTLMHYIEARRKLMETYEGDSFYANAIPLVGTPPLVARKSPNNMLLHKTK